VSVLAFCAGRKVLDDRETIIIPVFLFIGLEANLKFLIYPVFLEGKDERRQFVGGEVGIRRRTFPQRPL
jgi:hypothetical protein